MHAHATDLSRRISVTWLHTTARRAAALHNSRSIRSHSLCTHMNQQTRGCQHTFLSNNKSRTSTHVGCIQEPRTEGFSRCSGHLHGLAAECDTKGSMRNAGPGCACMQNACHRHSNPQHASVGDEQAVVSPQETLVFPPCCCKVLHVGR